MNTQDVVRSVLDALNELAAPYMVVGSVATNFYCIPRSTQDADIVVPPRLTDVARQLAQRLETLRFDPQLAFESVTATTKALLHTSDHDFHIELFELGDDEHDQQRFARRIRIETLGTRAWIATLEDMIVTKLRWARHAGREQDVADVRNLISVQKDSIDWPYVESWCDRHSTRGLLEKLREQVRALGG